MNIHVNAATRGEHFCFAIGQAVDHRDGGWPAVIVGRYRGEKRGTPGPELYEIVIADGACEGERRLMLGESLIALPY